MTTTTTDGIHIDAAIDDREPPWRPVAVPMVGQDGNAFAIIGRVQKALRYAGASRDEVRAWTDDATQSGSYGGLLAFVMETVDVDEVCGGCGADDQAVYGCEGLGWVCRRCEMECGCAVCDDDDPTPCGILAPSTRFVVGDPVTHAGRPATVVTVQPGGDGLATRYGVAYLDGDRGSAGFPVGLLGRVLDPR